MLARLRSVTRTVDRGASAVEYGLLVAGIAAVIVAVVFLFGTFINDVFQDTCDSISAESGVGPDCGGGGGLGGGGGGGVTGGGAADGT